MNPRHNYEWLCKYSMWDTYATKQGDKCFHCALKEFQARDLKVNIPVRGCWPDECIHNPESDDYKYDLCCSEEFHKLNKCPHADDCTWCKIGTAVHTVPVATDSRCWITMRSMFHQVGGCPHYAELTREEVANKLKVMCTESGFRSSFLSKGTNLYKWVKLAEAYAGVTTVSDYVAKWLESRKEKTDAN